MRLKLIPPFKSMDLPPGVLSTPHRLLADIEAEGLLKGVQWDLDEGVPGPSVKNREELAQVIPGVLKVVRQAAESGRYDAIAILGGLDPGLYAAREIGAAYGIPVVGTTHSAVLFAYGLGHRFAVIDVLEGLAIVVRQMLMSYGLNDKCASVRSMECHVQDIRSSKGPELVEKFVRECIDAIEKDGADVIVCGCTATLLLRPQAQKRLAELGYDVPVLDGYRCAIEFAKAQVGMRISQSRIAYPDSVVKNRSIPR